MDSKKILTHTIDVIDPYCYIGRKLFKKNDYSGGLFWGISSSKLIPFMFLGIVYTYQKPSYEKVNFDTHNIQYMTETIAGEGESNNKGFIYAAKLFVSPWWLLHTHLTKTKHTVINDKYMVEGTDIIQFSTDQGYFINEAAFETRAFRIDNKKYNLSDLEEELNELLESHDEVKKELRKKSISGDYESAMNQNTEYYMRIKELRKDINEVYEAKRTIVTALKKTAQDLNEEIYPIRSETQREAEKLKQLKGNK